MKKTPVDTFVCANRYLQTCVGACVYVCAHVFQCKGRSVCATLNWLQWFRQQSRLEFKGIALPLLPFFFFFSYQPNIGSHYFLFQKALDNRVYMLLRYLNNFKLYIRIIQESEMTQVVKFTHGVQ